MNDKKNIIIDFFNVFNFYFENYIDENENLDFDIKKFFKAMRSDYIISYITFENNNGDLDITIIKTNEVDCYIFKISSDYQCFTSKFEYRKESHIRYFMKKNLRQIIDVVKSWYNGDYR